MNNNRITINNDFLTVQINPHGACLTSVCETGEEGPIEYLWQGDSAYWAEQAPNLFPYVGRLTMGSYQLDNKMYQMDIHGFAKDSLFDVIMVHKDKAVFAMRDDSRTYAQYPYHFQLEIIYQLTGKRLDVTFKVENWDEKEMYFGIGGHPGFNVPIEKDLRFEDYFLEFAEDCHPKQICFSTDHFVEGEPIPYVLSCERILPLTHELFDEDALVLTDMPRRITLRSRKGKKALSVNFPEMDYVGLWHAPRTDAPYVCIEPWATLPSRKGIVEDLATQPGLVRLGSGESFSNVWNIEIC